MVALQAPEDGGELDRLFGDDLLRLGAPASHGGVRVDCRLSSSAAAAAAVSGSGGGRPNPATSASQRQHKWSLCVSVGALE